METLTDALTRDDVHQFHRHGYLGPFAAYSPDDMAQLRSRIESEVLTTPGPSGNPLKVRHLDQRLIYDMVTNPGVLNRIRSLLGNDIVMWATFLFNKEPGGSEIPWHQDANYWPIEPALNISIWMAVDEVTAENSCVQLIPGSHRSVVPHVPSRDGMAFGEEADPGMVDTERAINMELKPGEFFIFNERMLHHSDLNKSQKRRMGLSARYTLPIVDILDQDSSPLFPGHTCVVVSGEDRMGLNRTAKPPTT